MFSAETNNGSRIRLHNTFGRQIAPIRAQVGFSVDLVSRCIISVHMVPGWLRKTVQPCFYSFFILRGFAPNLKMKMILVTNKKS